MSINSPQSPQAGEDLYDGPFKSISRQPSLSQLYSDAAAYDKLLAQTGCLESLSAGGENSFAAFVDLDSTDTDSILSRLSNYEQLVLLTNNAI